MSGARSLAEDSMAARDQLHRRGDHVVVVAFEICHLKATPCVWIGDDFVRHEADVDIDQDNDDEAGPRPTLMVGVPDGYIIPGPLPRACPFRAAEAIQPAADEVAQRMARERVHHEEEGVQGEKD